MNKKICITSVRSVGCTFVDWSIHFLSGQSVFYNTNLKQYIDLSQSPLNKINAHGHKKNCPLGSEKFKSDLDTFELLRNDAIYSTYPCPISLDTAAQHLEIPIDQIGQKNILQKITNYILDDYNKIFKICKESQTKLIFVSTDPNTILYHSVLRTLERFATKPEKPESESDWVNGFQKSFFDASLKEWSKLQLTNIWDIRERMALDTRPMFNPFNDRNFDFCYPHLWINCQELWLNPVDTIKKILNYLDLKIDPDRYNLWLPICYKWQKIQSDALNFCYTQSHIVDAIINNWDYKINLTFQQEVIIQHFLIYKHNLNLKTWQLEKFPDNTLELHKLLEENIHPVEDIYNSKIS
jgi:hypothetical protein